MYNVAHYHVLLLDMSPIQRIAFVNQSYSEHGQAESRV